MSLIAANTATTIASSSTTGTSASANAPRNGGDFEFSEEMYSDPAMRPYLEQYYNKSYAPIRERIAAMRERDDPATITTADGTVAQELSADQYEKMIPSFDKWLEVQQLVSAFDFEDQTAQMLEHAKQSVTTLENHSPDTKSDVRVVFSNGDQILGYMDKMAASPAIAAQAPCKPFQAWQMNWAYRARRERTISSAKAARPCHSNIRTFRSVNTPTKRPRPGANFHKHGIPATILIRTTPQPWQKPATTCCDNKIRMTAYNQTCATCKTIWSG